jgi:hypothetical protein
MVTGVMAVPAVAVAGYAVDGNTDGYFLNKSTTHTEYEHGAWWQVDLGSKKNINQIIIYNRTDCCASEGRPPHAMIEPSLLMAAKAVAFE